jgi:hypothetical protein
MGTTIRADLGISFLHDRDDGDTYDRDDGDTYRKYMSPSSSGDMYLRYVSPIFFSIFSIFI